MNMIAGVAATRAYASMAGTSPMERVDRPVVSANGGAKGTADSAEAVTDEHVWREMGAKYDVHSMTFDEMDDMSQALYKAGQITLADHALMSFDPSKGMLGTNDGYVLTGQDEDGAVDWVAEYKERRDQHARAGQLHESETDQHVLNILRKVEAAAGRGVNLSI